MPLVLKQAMLRKANDSLRTGGQERVAQSLQRFSDILDGKKKTDRIKIEEALRAAGQRVVRDK